MKNKNFVAMFAMAKMAVGVIKLPVLQSETVNCSPLMYEYF